MTLLDSISKASDRTAVECLMESWGGIKVYIRPFTLGEGMEVSAGLSDDAKSDAAIIRACARSLCESNGTPSDFDQAVTVLEQKSLRSIMELFEYVKAANGWAEDEKN